MKTFKYWENYQNVTQSEQMPLENGANRLAGYRVATNLQCIKNTVSARCNKTKYT